MIFNTGEVKGTGRRHIRSGGGWEGRKAFQKKKSLSIIIYPLPEIYACPHVKPVIKWIRLQFFSKLYI